jgi:preprotein translocase subunit YajC
MNVVMLHGGFGFVDEFVVMFVVPLVIFGGLYWWSSRKGKKKEAEKSDLSDQPPGP